MAGITPLNFAGPYGFDPSAVYSATPGTSSGTVNDSLLGQTVAGILGLQNNSLTDTANAKAEAAAATGYSAQVTAYGQVGTIAEQNAALAQAAGDVKGIQLQREAMQTIGTQQAQVAGGGFRTSGSSMDILRGSLQQSYLTQQLNETQTGINVGGYLSEKAAAGAQGAAAQAGLESANALGKSYLDASTLATTNAASETDALKQYLTGVTLTPAEQMMLSPLGSTFMQSLMNMPNFSNPLTIAAKYDPTALPYGTTIRSW